MTEEIKPKISAKENKIASIIEIPTQVERYVELEDGTKVDELGLNVLIYNRLNELLRRL